MLENLFLLTALASGTANGCNALVEEKGDLLLADETSETSRLPSKFDNNDSDMNPETQNVSNADLSTYVQGRVMGKKSDGSLVPLKNYCVEIFDDNLIVDTRLGTVYTDADGYYRCTFQNDTSFLENGGCDPYARVWAASRTFEVCPVAGTVYHVDSYTTGNVATGTTLTYNFTINLFDGSDTSRAFVIAEAMRIAQDFAHNEGNMPLNGARLRVNYPTETTSFSFGVFSGISTADWERWDIIVHEYGHYVEYLMGTYGADLGEIIFNNPSHATNKDHFNDKFSKEYALHLTWSESWATVFAMVLDDVNYENFRSFTFAKEMVHLINSYSLYKPDGIESGEAQEDAVIAYLWNLYDSYNDSVDTVSLTPGEFLKSSLKDGMVTLDAFVDDFEDNHQDLVAQNAILLESFQIAPNLYPFRSVAVENIPLKVEFAPHGSFHNPNDEFTIQFFSQKGDLFYSVVGIRPKIPSNLATVSYTIAEDEWATIYRLAVPYSFVYVSVEGFHNANPRSGPYRSAFEILYMHESISLNPSDFVFPDSYCPTEESKPVYLIGFSFFTRRLRTGFIQDEYINLSPRKEGFGTAYLELEFPADVHSIVADLSFWSNDERYYSADKPRAAIEYWDEDKKDWILALDLLKTNLPTDRYNQKSYTVYFPKSVNLFRFYAHFENMTGYTDRNKGRISIGPMDIYFQGEI